MVFTFVHSIGSLGGGHRYKQHWTSCIAFFSVVLLCLAVVITHTDAIASRNGCILVHQCIILAHTCSQAWEVLIPQNVDSKMLLTQSNG